MTTCSTEPVIGCVNEGSDCFINYHLKDEDGNDITSIDTFSYKLSDGLSVLIDWTVIAVPDLPSGTIQIPGDQNIIAKNSPSKRIFTIFSTYAGVKTVSKTVEYGIIKSINIDETSPP